MLDQIARQLEDHSARPAVFLNAHYYTYGELAAKIATIQAWIGQHEQSANTIIGVVANSDLETYASMLAILFCGHGYLPINPNSPVDRNVTILQQAGSGLLLASNEESLAKLALGLPDLRVVSTRDIRQTTGKPFFKSVPDSHYAYLLFTSGSTGIPKGVPISRSNLEAFLAGFFDLGIDLNENDRVLQMFDLTFDFSVMSCFVPLVVGACLYPAASNELRFMSVYRLLEEQQITCAPMVPSALTFLRPYFKEIHLENLRFSIFCGEPLLSDIAQEWADCAPNSRIINFYGPTEATVFCSAYEWSHSRQKSLNGALSIGKPMLHSTMLVVDEQRSILPLNQVGEICLAGAQLTSGYWNDPQKNQEAFFEIGADGSYERFYRTGDLGYIDADGDFMFQGRLDQQVKVQGFRIELAEIEHHARACAGVKQAVAVAIPNRDGNTELILCVQDYLGDTRIMLAALKHKLPSYMIPARVVNVPVFPLNKNGKIDRPALRKYVSV